MTAVGTAAEVLAWALNPAGSPPAGDLTDAAALAAPEAELLDLLRQVAVRTAAVLGAGARPFGDDGSIGLGAVLVAAAVGGRQQLDAARLVAGAAPPLDLAADDAAAGEALAVHGWRDAVARHGVTGAFAAAGGLPVTGDGLCKALLAASPLSAVLLRPSGAQFSADGGVDPLESLAALLGRPRGPEVLTTAFAAPVRDVAVLTWRARALTESPAVTREVLFGVYLAARLRHGADWDELIDQVRWKSGMSGLRGAVIRFWAPLAAMDRADRELLPSQPFLDGYRPAVSLAAPYAATAGN